MPEASLPEIIGGRYKPIRLIGQGGMGAVYEVEHAHTGDHLALKVLLARLGTSDEAHERFRREARASARIKSEHVVRITDADIAPELHDAPFLVMELLEGMDLEEYAATHTVAPADVVEWMRQVARAVDKAHRLGIIHRDLKPENVFLADRDDAPPIVKVLDFGIAKMTEDGGLATRSGQILGTPRYMAPEQASGKSADVGRPADLFALGLIAYRLLLGDHYYRSDSVMSVLAEVLHRPIDLPSTRGSTLGAGFDAWFLKACNKDQASRYASALVQIEDLAEALGFPRVELPARSHSDSRPGSAHDLGDAARIGEGATLVAPDPRSASDGGESTHLSSPSSPSSPSSISRRGARISASKAAETTTRAADPIAVSGQHSASLSIGRAETPPIARRSVPLWLAVPAVIGALGVGLYMSRSTASVAPASSAHTQEAAIASVSPPPVVSALPTDATPVPSVSAASSAQAPNADKIPSALPASKHARSPLTTARPQEIATANVATPTPPVAPPPPKPTSDPFDGQK